MARGPRVYNTFLILGEKHMSAFRSSGVLQKLYYSIASVEELALESNDMAYQLGYSFHTIPQCF